jgi:hypothetical protein
MRQPRNLNIFSVRFSIQRYSALFSVIQRFSALFSVIQRYSALFSVFQRFSAFVSVIHCLSVSALFSATSM